MKWMNLHHLKYFLVIAEEGSLSAASRKLLVGQPALSAQLKQFEDWLGQQLFRREGKRLVITAAGEYVLKYAKAIKELEDELLLNMNHAEDLLKKELVLGAQEVVPKTVLARTIATISGARSVKLKVIEGTGEELFNMLAAGKIDMFIGNFRPMSEGREMAFISLGKESVSVYGPKTMAPLKRGFPESLEGQRFVLPGFQTPVRHDFEKYMLQHGLSFKVAVEAQDSALLKELSILGQGLVLIGDESARSSVKTGTLIKLGSLTGLKEEYWLGMAKKAIDNEHIRRMVEAFK